MKRILIILPILVLLYPLTSIADNRLNYAAKLFHEANYIKAIEELKAVSKEGEEGSSIYFEISYLLGMSYRELKDWKEAADWLQKASRYQPLADYALFYLGESYLSAADYESALSAFQTLRSKFPESRWKEAASFKAANALFQLGRYNEALPSFDAFIRENPRSPLIPTALLNMGQGFEKDGKLEEAFNSYQKIWLSYPTSSESRVASARMADISTPSSSLHPPSADERFKRVGVIFSCGSYNDVINELSSLLKEVEKEGSPRPQWLQAAKFKLAEAYFNIKSDEKAEAVLKNLIESNASEESLFLYGKVLQRSGKRVEASSAYERIGKAYPKGDFAARALFRQADMAEGDGDASKTRELYHKFYTVFPQHGLADDALWKEGWLSYLERNYEEASIVFQKLLNEYPNSEYIDTVSYWSGRIAEKAGNRDEAVAKYSNIVNNFPMSYYSVLGRGRLFAISPETPLSRHTKAVSYLPPYRHQTPDKYLSFHLSKGKLLLDLGFNKDASVEFTLAEARCSDTGTLLEIAGLQTKAGDYFRPQRVMLNSFQEYLREDKGQLNADIWAFAFPLGFSDYVKMNADKNSLNPYLIHAIIREESTYRPEVVSRAGAIGLMQMMPATGSILSREQGFKGFTSQTLYRADVNITMGSLYLKKLIEDHKGSLPLAIASYNAGPNAVATWISRYGTDEMDEFIEKIPYSETRNYVKKVLRSYNVYEKLYSTRNRSDEPNQ